MPRVALLSLRNGVPVDVDYFVQVSDQNLRHLIRGRERVDDVVVQTRNSTIRNPDKYLQA